MKLLVTGATGFIGGHLVRRLVRDGHHVVALVRDPAKARGLPDTNIEWLRGDLSLFADPATVLPACDAVVHLAGAVAAEHVDDYHAINYVAVRDLVACLERQTWRPRRLLFASSVAAAGPTRDGAPKTEADACEPIEPYGRSKRLAEDHLQHAPFPTTTFRPALVIGERDPATLTLYRLAQRGLGFRAAGRSAGLSFVDIDDLVDAVLAMLADRSTAHRTYFVAHTEPTDIVALWRALGETVARDVHVVPIPRPALYATMIAMTALAKRFGFKNQLDIKQYEQIASPGFVCSSAALQRDLGWRPVHGLSHALAKAATGYRTAGML